MHDFQILNQKYASNPSDIMQSTRSTVCGNTGLIAEFTRFNEVIWVGINIQAGRDRERMQSRQIQT